MLWSSLEAAYEEGTHYWRVRDKVGTLDAREREAFLDLIGKMLKFRPEERITAEDVLRSDWVAKWVLRDVERSLASG